MAGRGAALADQFEKVLGELTQTVESMPDDRWQATCPEGWTVAATAQHVAAQFPLALRQGITHPLELIRAHASHDSPARGNHVDAPQGGTTTCRCTAIDAEQTRTRRTAYSGWHALPPT